MAEVQSETKTAVLIQVDFWHSRWGILLKRVLFLSASAAVSGVVGFLANNPLLFGGLTPIVYTFVTFIKDTLDKEIPNSTEDTIRVSK